MVKMNQRWYVVSCLVLPVICLQAEKNFTWIFYRPETENKDGEMRTTLNIDDELLEQALKLTNITSKSELIRRAPKALVEKESAWRLAKMGGSQPGLKPITRRCFADDPD